MYQIVLLYRKDPSTYNIQNKGKRKKNINLSSLVIKQKRNFHEKNDSKSE